MFLLLAVFWKEVNFPHRKSFFTFSIFSRWTHIRVYPLSNLSRSSVSRVCRSKWTCLGGRAASRWFHYWGKILGCTIPRLFLTRVVEISWSSGVKLHLFYLLRFGGPISRHLFNRHIVEVSKKLFLLILKSLVLTDILPKMTKIGVPVNWNIDCIMVKTFRSQTVSGHSHKIILWFFVYRKFKIV